MQVEALGSQFALAAEEDSRYRLGLEFMAACLICERS